MELAPIQNNKIAYLDQGSIQNLALPIQQPHVYKPTLPNLGDLTGRFPQPSPRDILMAQQDQQSQMFEVMASFMSSLLDRVMQMVEGLFSQLLGGQATQGISATGTSTVASSPAILQAPITQSTETASAQLSSQNSDGSLLSQIGGLVDQGLGLWKSPSFDQAIEFGKNAWDVGKTLYNEGKSWISSGISFIKDLF